jgi:hypothetical protein
MTSANSFEQKPRRRRGPGKPFVKGLSGNGFGIPFKPGESGNPSGRPKALHDVVELARTHTPAAIAALVDALNNPRERVAAATVLLDRAWGRAPQVVVGDEERPVAIAFSWAPAQPQQPEDDIALPVAQPLTIDIEPESAPAADSNGSVILWKS